MTIPDYFRPPFIVDVLTTAGVVVLIVVGAAMGVFRSDRSGRAMR